MIILEGLSKKLDEAEAQTTAIAAKILTVINKRYIMGDRQHQTSASIGITMFGTHPALAEDLVKQADMAMYESKLAGRNAMHFFDPEYAFSLRAALWCRSGNR